MLGDRILLIQRIAQNLRQGADIDIYALVEELKTEFPDVPEAELARIVSEEVIVASASAFWEKRGHKPS